MASRKFSSKVRNPLHDHPLMRKGGVHEKSNKAKRKKVRQEMRKEWFCSIALI